MKPTLGAERKKVATLAVLVVVAGYLLYTNFSEETPAASAPASPTTAAKATPSSPNPMAPVPAPDVRRGAARNRDGTGGEEFRPSLKPRRPEDRRDPATIDPALRLELLAKLQSVKLEGGQRSLFEFSQPRPPKTPDVKILPKPVAAAAKPDGTPTPPAAVENTPPAKPPAPPITLKFFGFINPARGGGKRAFFLDGEDIYVAGEGDLIKKRFKVVRIGVNSAVLEDTEHQHQQTIPLVPEQIG